jgi:hypothetical protein
MFTNVYTPSIVFAQSDIDEEPKTNQEQVPQRLGGNILLGANICIENGKDKCRNVDPAFGMSISALYRPIEYFAVDFTFYLGNYSIKEGDASAYMLGVLGGLRAYLPLKPVDIFAGIGIGWGQDVLAFSDHDVWTQGFTMAFTGGAEYIINDIFSVGVLVRYYLPMFDELCGDSGGDTHCNDLPDTVDNSHELMVGASLSFYLDL